jgi:anti-anti-sigma factor
MERLHPHLTPFAVSAAGDDWLVVSGEVDMSTSPILRLAIEEAEDTLPERLTIDLSAVRFIDVSGLRELLMAARRALAEERRVVLASPPRMIRRLLALTAIDQSAEVLMDGRALETVSRLPEAG